MELSLSALSLSALAPFAAEKTARGLRFTQSFTFTLTADPAPLCPCVLRAECAAHLPEAQLIYRLYAGEELIYTSLTYSFYVAVGDGRLEWRVPPFVGGADRVQIEVRIPQDGELELYAIAINPEPARAPYAGGLRLNAHLGFWGIAPNNTMPAFELAHQCGYPACIVVPKATADGELVCIHDDTINRTAHDREGNPVTEPVAVADLTLNELREYEYGSYKHRIWTGTPIPRLEDFFALCARTGMRPMFSTHPALTREQWLQVKQLLVRYGLTRVFHIKSFEAEVLALAWEIFGDSIEGYTFDVRTRGAREPEVQVATLRATGIDPSRVRVGIEIPADDMTPERAAIFREAGYFAAVWKLKDSSSARYRELMAMGVTEFTDDFNCSAGLNWA